MNIPRQILPFIVIAQFLCTSLWFAGNGVLTELMLNFKLPETSVGYLTSSVQLGFILGTLIFALLSMADRYAPSKVFMVCALLGAATNMSIVWNGNTYASLLAFRFATGFFLAGIYPVGMKIAADYFEKGLGKSLGYLVGALAVGTALPHLLNDLKGTLSWAMVLIGTSSFALIGGLLIYFFVPDGPYRTPSQQVNIKAIPILFKKPGLRSAAVGYFGHMWELYAFWAFVPLLLKLYTEAHPTTSFNTSMISFSVIAIGGLSCVMGSYLAHRVGLKKVAYACLLSSGLCCLLLPWVIDIHIPEIYIAFLLFWGMVVIADSPLFSTLVAENALPHLKGTALTIVNSIGFALTILSIQLLNFWSSHTGSPKVLMLLALGPFVALLSAAKNRIAH
ncbi:MAG: MFS transporter [Flavobacteriaceae bacterium]|nr:MFS transporter [Flavobacteriaceae bacterium]